MESNIKKRKYSVCLVGAGRIAGGFDADRPKTSRKAFTYAGAIQSLKKTYLKSVYDSSPGQAKKFASTWRVENIIDTFHEVLSNFHDVICICTPDATHFNYAQQILNAKCCRILIVEKPLAMQEAEIIKLFRLEKKTGIKVLVNFQRSFDPFYSKLKDFFNRGVCLGAQAQYNKGLKHIGVTLFAQLINIFGQPQYLQTIDRKWNSKITDYSYDFILFYSSFNIQVLALEVHPNSESASKQKDFNIFELEIYFNDRRIRLIENSRFYKQDLLNSYIYPGVNLYIDSSKRNATDYDHSMTNFLVYIEKMLSKFSIGKIKHINSIEDYATIHGLVLAVEKSFKHRKKVKV